MQEHLRSANKETQVAKEKGIWLSHLRINEIEASYERLVDQTITYYEPLLPLEGKKLWWVQAKEGT